MRDQNYAAQAEAQAAKTRLDYAEKDMSIKVEKAHFEATLDALHLEKEAYIFEKEWEKH